MEWSSSMKIKKLLIANRGEIAIRIARTASEMGIRTVCVFSEDDSHSLHNRMANEARPLHGAGAAAYLDLEQILETAKDCDAIHPGYGFLSESALFARRCADAGVLFIGPSPEVLELLGDKTKARELAISLGVAVASGIDRAVSIEEAEAFFSTHHSVVVIKARAGGGGRGMRVVSRIEEIPEAYARCRSEALSAFGNGDLYVEELIAPARHIEVQIIGDGQNAAHLWDRECSIQRQHQKLIEIAPSLSLSPEQRQQITSAAVLLAEGCKYRGIGTFEFLMTGERFVFLEANPRLQVEHTVTEEITGLDLVRIQLEIAAGARLGDFEIRPPRGFAMQLRINMETMEPTARARPAGGVLTEFEAPSGPGVRVDTFGYRGYRTTSNFDSLLAKLIVHSPTADQVIPRACRALSEFRIEGVPANLVFLRNVLLHPDFQNNRISTRFIDEHITELLPPSETATAEIEDSQAVLSPMQGTVIGVQVSAGDIVAPGQPLLIMEAMKMEHVIAAEHSGVVRLVNVRPGQAIFEKHPLLYLEKVDAEAQTEHRMEEEDPDAIRPDLAELRERQAITLDERRPEAVARRRKTGQRTARENIEALCDAGSFVEYGALAIAAQRRRRKLEDLILQTPADGLVAGLGKVNGSRAMVLAYDYTVLAGTQGKMNHKKTDRVLQLAEKWRLPVVLFAEGGGGRPGDTDTTSVGGLDTPSFVNFARLSGKVPLVGVVSGYCFAGNAALVGCCDVIIATENSNIGMGGPAMIEGGGLGVFRPEEIGPIAVQSANGVVDIRACDEVEAVQIARKYLAYFQQAYFQHAGSPWTVADQRQLRRLIPENRLRVYDIRKVIETLADEGSVLELRAQFGIGMVTALIRIEGRPIGLIANNPKHLSGAIDADGADKASRFMQLCDAFGIPILSLCDTPGFMVGPEIEKQAQVRHVCRMYVTAAACRVPFLCVVLRKGYGLGAMAMAAGSFDAPMFTISWPTGEFGGMGLEGAVRLGFRRELEAAPNEQERKALYERLVAEMYQKGKAINVASVLEIDAVIDPVETRGWIIRGLDSVPEDGRTEAGRGFVDTW
jgi:acetyl/propionyl-CoA carboxylase alpha subunit